MTVPAVNLEFCLATFDIHLCVTLWACCEHIVSGYELLWSIYYGFRQRKTLFFIMVCYISQSCCIQMSKGGNVKFQVDSDSLPGYSSASQVGFQSHTLHSKVCSISFHTLIQLVTPNVGGLPCKEWDPCMILGMLHSTKFVRTKLCFASICNYVGRSTIMNSRYSQIHQDIIMTSSWYHHTVILWTQFGENVCLLLNVIQHYRWLGQAWASPT